MAGQYVYKTGFTLAFLAALAGAAVAAQVGRSLAPAAPIGERKAALNSSARASESAEAKARLTGVRLLSSPTYTRVTLDLNQATRYEVSRLPDDPKRGLPHRIYIDIAGTRLAMDSLEPIQVQDGVVRQVRVGQNSDSVVRVVLDMEGLREYKAYILSDPYRLVIDVQEPGRRAPDDALVSAEKNKTAGAAALPEQVKPAPVVETAKPIPAPIELAKPTAPPAPADRSKTAAPAPAAEKSKTLAALPPVATPRPAMPGIHKIVLDPGHGGRDPGATGVDGLAEKDIVLRVAKKLAAKLQKDLGIQVVLTRKDDSYVPLENRTAIANAEDADLFISLHMNAAPTADAKGLETYYLDNTTDEASIRLAARENSTSRAQISDLQFILSDMTQNSKLEDSVTLAHKLHGSVIGAMSKKIGEVRDLGVKKALFYVLVGARMPSVLVEMFFITNKTEGRAMGQEANQDAVVDALYEGILNYNQSALAIKTL